jgi:tRNA(Ile)-lysidine synthase
MPPLHPLEQKLAARWAPELWQDVTVVAAISGGADSVALLRALAACKLPGPGRLIAAHFNHQLRGAESDADQHFVVALCQKLGLECKVGQGAVTLRAQDDGDGLEAAARSARYEFLTSVAEEQGARYVVTAHNADDQAETILHHILRGTGLAGLEGMPATRLLNPAVSLLRPLLEIRRTELVTYLDSLKQPFQTDASNFDGQFTRSRIRHELLPRLAADFNPRVVEALLRLGSLAGEAQEVIDSQIRRLAERCVWQASGSRMEIDIRALGKQPHYMVRELLIFAWRTQAWPQQAMGFTEWNLLAAMLTDPPAGETKRMFPGQVIAERKPDRLILVRQ